MNLFIRASAILVLREKVLTIFLQLLQFAR